MDKELKKGIKKLLLLDSVISSSGSLSKILDETERELEEMFGKPKKKPFQPEEIIKFKTFK